jgi:hypothetical protein
MEIGSVSEVSFYVCLLACEWHCLYGNKEELGEDQARLGVLTFPSSMPGNGSVTSYATVI